MTSPRPGLPPIVRSDGMAALAASRCKGMTMHEDTTFDAPGVGGGISRRDMLRKSAVVGGAGALMWAAPSITTYGARAFAGTPPPDLCPDGAGQPTGLEWKYVGGGCGDSDNDQQCGTDTQCEGCCYCVGVAPNGASRVKIRALREGGLEQELFDVAVGDTFFVPADSTKKAGASQRFEVFDKDDEGNETLVHEVQVHTSCSQPLRIGDRFGAFKLIGGTASFD